MGLIVTIAEIEAWLVQHLSERLGIETNVIDRHQPFSSYGLASIEGVALSKSLSDWLHIDLSPTLAWEYPSIAELAKHIAGAADADETPARAPTQQMVANEPIAIIGMGCRFPQAEGLDSFWQMLCEGADAISEIPPMRWDVDHFYNPNPSNPGTMQSRWGGFLDHIDQFDAHFFGISPREAAQLDPRQRLMLEVAWEALEDAGIPPSSLAGSRTGVFTANLSSNYGTIIFHEHIDIVDIYSGTGNGNSVTANRLSYFFNLHGPSIAIDTACSGALVALHLACQSLQQGESSLALVGGANVILKPDDSVFFTKAGALAPDGRCKVFDSQANGIVRSEGAGIVVLKPLSQALADHDHIYALIRGSAVNQDGASNGIMAPNGQAQEALLREAYQRAAIDPAEVQLIEAHGTGTSLGDPIEAKAIGAVVGRNRPANRNCALGSVKTNIGHTEAAAGVASLIKTALAIKHRQIPPNIHFQKPNPLIPFDELPIFVPQQLQAWNDQSIPLVAGVSGFGFAGTNAHVVLSEAPAQRSEHQDLAGPWVLPISARSPEALTALAAAYTPLLRQTTGSAYDLCYNASMRRGHLEQRLALVVESYEEAEQQINAFLSGDSSTRVVQGRRRLDRQPSVVWVFSGQGSHWAGMGQSLFEHEPVFRSVMEQCDRLFRAYADWSLLDTLAASDEHSQLNDTERSQPAIFAIQVALATLWRSWGITPSAIVGQSLGEVAAAHVAGALSLEDAVRVVAIRSQLMKRVAGKGQTAVIGLPLAQAQLVISGWEDVLAIAGTSSPNTCVLSGDSDALKRVLRSLEHQGIFCRLIQGVDVAFHSPQMDPLKDELAEALVHITPRAATIPLYSTVTARQVTGTELDGDYWARNLREPFLFSPTLKLLADLGYDSYLEISSHPVLTASIKEALHSFDKPGTLFSSLRRNEPERKQLLATLAELYVAGFSIDWSQFFPQPAPKVDLPHYQWQRQRYWFDQLFDQQRQKQQTRQIARTQRTHPLLDRHVALATPHGQHVWTLNLDDAFEQYLSDHRVQGAVVFPGAAYLEVALSAAKEALGSPNYALEQIAFSQGLFLNPAQPREIEAVLAPLGTSRWHVQVYSRLQNTANWQLHARAEIIPSSQSVTPRSALRIGELQRQLEPLAAETHYTTMAIRGLQYGPHFQAVKQLWRRNGEALAEIQLPPALQADQKAYLLHPVLLDAAFQVVATAVSAEGEDALGAATFLPTGIGAVTRYQACSEQLRCHVHLRSDLVVDTNTLFADIELSDMAGNLVVRVEQLQLSRLEAQGSAEIPLDDWFYTIDWELLSQGRRHSALVNLPGPQATAALVQPHARQFANQLDLDHYEKSIDEFNQLARLYVQQALLELGCVFGPGSVVVADQLATQLGIVPHHRRLFKRMFGMLEEAGILARDSAGMRVVHTLAPTEPTTLLRHLQHTYPANTVIGTLVEACGLQLANVLRGTTNPASILFPNGSFTALETLYEQTPNIRVYNLLLQQALTTIIEQLPPDSTVRILEIGAGTGSLTSFVLPVLAHHNVEYVFTDLSPLFLQRAKEKFAEYPFVQYQLFDAEKPINEQGLEPKSFDLILAANVLHATRDLREVVSQIRQMLTDQGQLFVLEGLGKQAWLDITFGLTEGWWNYTDTTLRPDYPLISVERWKAIFAETGYAESADLIDMQASTIQTVLLARTAAATPQPSLTTSSWLVFADHHGVAEHLATQLGFANQRVIKVLPGESFAQIDAHSYMVDPTNSDDMVELLTQAFPNNQPACRGIVHLWGLDMHAAPDSLADLEQQLATGSQAIMHLIQALIRTDWYQNTKLWILTRGANTLGDQHTINPLQSSLWGFGRVLATEHPELFGGLIDLDPQAPDNEIEDIFEQLTQPSKETQLAFRDRQSFGARIERAVLAANQAPPIALRTDGAYLITGGLGGIGLEVASWLAAHGARRLILLSRTELPPRSLWNQLGHSRLDHAITTIRALEAQGVSIHLGAVDIGDDVQLSAFLAQYQQEGWPPIRGVFHSAGLINDQLIIRMETDVFESVVHPKIRGAWLLHQLLADTPLDYFVLFSSASSLFGTSGQANYAAGNAFMDALAQYRHHQGLPALSINWGVWADVGIVARMGGSEFLAQNGLMNILPQRGLEALERMLQHNLPQVAAMPTNWAKWREVHPTGTPPLFYRVVNDQDAPEGTDQNEQANSSALQELSLLAPEMRQEHVIHSLAEMVAAIMRFDLQRLDVYQPLNTLGIDSIIAIELKHRIERMFGVALSVVDILQGNSIDQLANKVLDSLTLDDDLAALLAEIEQLPLEDVQALLEGSQS